METKDYLNEIWRDIKGYEGLYQVSNYGRIKSLDKCKRQWRGGLIFIRGKLLKLHTQGNGYYNIQLFRNGVYEYKYIHRLVAEAFLPNPNNLTCVNHKDENPANNFIWVNEDNTVDTERSNLEWCTQSYNVNYGTRNRRVAEKQINRGDCSKPILQFSKSGVLLKEYPSIAEATRETGVQGTHIIQVCQMKPKHKTAGGFIWRYKEAS